MRACHRAEHGREVDAHATSRAHCYHGSDGEFFFSFSLNIWILPVMKQETTLLGNSGNVILVCVLSSGRTAGHHYLFMNKNFLATIVDRAFVLKRSTVCIAKRLITLCKWKKLEMSELVLNQRPCYKFGKRGKIWFLPGFFHLVLSDLDIKLSHEPPLCWSRSVHFTGLLCSGWKVPPHSSR